MGEGRTECWGEGERVGPLVGVMMVFLWGEGRAARERVGWLASENVKGNLGITIKLVLIIIEKCMPFQLSTTGITSPN